jgi:hypothetical protein
MNDTNQTYKHPDPQSDYEEGEIVDPSKLTPQPMQQLQFSTTQQHQWAAQNQPNFNPNSFVEITPKLKVLLHVVTTTRYLEVNEAVRTRLLL